MDIDKAERAAVTAGAATMVAGLAALIAPERIGGPIGMKDHPAVIRAIGISDVVTAPGLLVGRPRWPWMIARAALNAGIAVSALRYRNALGNRNAAIGAAAFTALIVVDGAAAATLRVAGR